MIDNRSMVFDDTRNRTPPPQMRTPLRVVIVEDRITDAELMAAELRRTGFDLDWVRVDRSDAFIDALANPPDIVLADYSLPEFDAMRALGVLWQHAPTVPLIVVTGQLGDEAAAECMKLGASDYVLKDRLARLGPAVEIALQQRRIEQERAQAVSALEESEERLTLVLEGSQNSFWDWDLVTGTVTRSTELAKLLGYQPSDWDEMGPRWIELVHPDDRSIAAATMEAHLAGSRPNYEAEYRLRRADGTWIWILDQGRVVRTDADGVPLRAAGTYRDISEAKAVREQLTASLNELRELARRLQTVREEERAGISREVHDVLGQEMTGFKMDVKWLSDRLRTLPGPESIPPLLEKLDGMTRQLESTMTTIRRIATELRPAVLDALGLIAALEWQTSDFQRRYSIPCEFVSSHEDVEMETERATAIFRIVQEALTNVIRHAHASRVRVQFIQSDSEICVSIDDDGVGIRPYEERSVKSLGLLGMQERALMFGGQVDVSDSPGSGATVTLRMPAP